MNIESTLAAQEGDTASPWGIGGGCTKKWGIGLRSWKMYSICQSEGRVGYSEETIACAKMNVRVCCSVVRSWGL